VLKLVHYEISCSSIHDILKYQYYEYNCMKAICLNSFEHREFITTAHVMQDWTVDENGNFIEVRQTLETTSKPDADNLWTCAICGRTAKVLRDVTDLTYAEWVIQIRSG